MAVEQAGVPAVANVCEGFIAEAQATAALGGVPWLNVVNYPGHIDLYDLDTRNKYISELVGPGNDKALTTPIPAAAAAGANEPPETTVAFTGTFEEVIIHYREKMWSDGLPIIPPTVDKVKEFLKFTDYAPDALLTRAIAPSYRQPTPWWVAVNGVMAGCRPEYMPLLIAMTKCWGELNFWATQVSSTPGWSPITIISGPIKEQLGINIHHTYGKCGYQSNTSMGRFWNMFMRNLLEIRIEPPTDMGTHGMNFFNLMGENDEVCQQYKWKTMAEEQGFQYGDNVVSSMSCVSQTQAPAIEGTTGEDLMYRIAGCICEGQGAGWRLGPPAVGSGPKLGVYLFVITELVGQVLAKDGFDKDKMQEYLYNNARLTARYMETRFTYMGKPGDPGLGYFCKQVKDGVSWARKEFCESENPDRLIPMFVDKSKIRFILGGDEARNRIELFQSNGDQGAFTSMKVELPKNWDALYAASQLKKDLDNLPDRQYKCI